MPHIQLPHDHGQKMEEMLIHAPDAESFQRLAEMFRQLSDGTRLRLYWLLCHCEECVTNLSAMMDMSSPAVSHHLRLLRTAGLIVSRRDGKEVYYKAVDTPTARLLHDAMEGLMEITCPMDMEESC